MNMEYPKIDDEHSLIVRYAAKLADAEGNGYTLGCGSSLGSCESSMVNSSEMFTSVECQQHQDMIANLEASNRQIMEEIRRLRESELNTNCNNNLIGELHMLKQYKGELEDRMNRLHDGRKELMGQLEMLMATLKARDSKISSMPRMSSLEAGSVYSTTGSENCRSFSPTSLTGFNDASSPPPPYYNRSNSASSTTSSPPLSVTTSRTKRQFNELFNAADAINDALTGLVHNVTAANAANEQRSQAYQEMSHQTKLSQNPSGNNNTYYEYGAIEYES